VIEAEVRLQYGHGGELLRLSVFDPAEELVAPLNDFQPEHLTGCASV
jgi:hypothetical protein